MSSDRIDRIEDAKRAANAAAKQSSGSMDLLKNSTRAAANVMNSGSTSPSGQYTLNTNVTDAQAEQMGAQVTREQFERYMNDFVPYEESAIGSLGDASAQQAASSSIGDAARARASLERMRSRYGTSQTAGQANAEAHQTSLSTSLGALGAVNAGRQLDEDRDYNLMGSMLNLGNNVQSSATNSLTSASANEQQRENAYQSAKASADAAQSQQNAALASTAIMAAAIMM